jgi:hypothetical protein
MDTLQDVLSDVRVFLYSGIQHLPLSLAGTFLLLGMFTANYAMLFFLVGFLLATPLAHLLLDLLLKLVLPDSFQTKTGDVCQIVVPFASSSSDSYHVMSQWTAMVSFFVGYMIRNGVKLLTREPEPTGSIEVTEDQVKEMDRKASYRRTQALVALLSLVLLAVILFIMRFRTGCEGYVGFPLALVGFGTAGYFWYDALSAIGQDRLSDLFGVANRLLAPGAIANGPVVCLPVAV